MVPELGKPRVTEIQVRMDCNGCVQKIKKALHGINGIYDINIDLPQQKLTIIGWADPEKIVKAIRNTRRIATICSHTEVTDPDAQPAEQPQEASESGARPPTPETSNPPPPEAPQAEAAPPEPPKEPPEAPKDPPSPPSPPENPTPQDKPSPSPVAAEANASQPTQPPGPKDVGDVHFVYHHPPDYGYRYAYGHTHGRQWNRYHNYPAFPQEPPPPPSPQPIYTTHSYNTHRPSPYFTGYEYSPSPPQHTFHSRMDYYNDDYHDSNRNGNITTIFSDENPNACTIV